MKVGWHVRGDVDGFFGLFVANLLQLLLISVLCGSCGSRGVTHEYSPFRPLYGLISPLSFKKG